METWVKNSVQNNKISQKDSLNEYYLEGYILFQYELKGTEEGGVFFNVNRALKPNEIVGVKKEYSVDSVWVEIICNKN